MKNRTFCTIITQSHFPFASALYHSLAQFDNSIGFQVLVVDYNEKLDTEFEILSLDEVIEEDQLGQEVNVKYNHPGTLDQLRWSLKPILINYLFDLGYDKVIFTDPDTYYFSDYSFLFNELDDNDILLTPHWRGITPENNQSNFNLQFVGGLFNAGFIGVNKHAKDVMEWWAINCLYKCEKDFNNGHYVDQTYLNLMPIYFDKVKILKHQGCNVANWNQQVCERTERDGQVFINNRWEIVFIHFTTSTIRGILFQQDIKLAPYLEKYLITLKNKGFEMELDRLKPIKKQPPQKSRYLHIKNLIYKRVKFLK